MKLSQKQNPFSEFFAAFLKSSLNSKHSGKEVTLIVFVFWKLSSPKKVVRKMAQKSCFRGSFDKQHGRPSQALLKSPSQNLYHIHCLITAKSIELEKMPLIDMHILGTAC